jgi:ABC-type sulfate transport system substrate-binding protein
MLLAAGCGGSGGSGDGDKLTLAAYSTPREAYEQLIPEFQKTDAGKGVGFTQSDGGMITYSVVVFIVREGNPRNIRTWTTDQAGRRGLEPNPFTLGGAKRSRRSTMWCPTAPS